MTKNVPLTALIDNPFQPRASFDEATIQSLADEMKAEGFWSGSLQGRKNAYGKIELVFGHRRLRALKLLKVPTVNIEVLELSDAQMALRALEENLQREGLTDFEKADAVKRAVEIEKSNNGLSETKAIQKTASRLGLHAAWVTELCKISYGIPEGMRPSVQAVGLSAVTANRAKDFGGEAYIKTLIKQAKASKADSSIPKPSQTRVDKIRAAVNAVPAQLRDQIKQEVVKGTLTTPEQVKKRAERLKSSQVRKEKAAPPDLKAVIVGWTHKTKEWEQQMRDVIPYMDYVEEVPSIARDFRAELKKLIKTAEKLL